MGFSVAEPPRDGEDIRMNDPLSRRIAYRWGPYGLSTGGLFTKHCCVRLRQNDRGRTYRGTYLAHKKQPPLHRTTGGPLAWAYCRVLGGGSFL